MIDRSISAFLDDLGARTPTPGGGAASGVAAAMGLALFRMVFGYALKKADPAVEPALADAERRFGELDVRIRPLAERDASAFEQVAAAYKLPKESEAEKARRSAAIQAALVGAMAVPLEALGAVRDVLTLALPLRDSVRKNIAADLVNGAALLLAAAEGSWCNVAVNASYLQDRDRSSKALDRAAVMMQEIRDAQATIRDYGRELL